MLALFFCGELLLQIPCCLHFYVGTFSYRYRAAFIFMWGLSLTHPVLASFFLFFFLSGEFLLRIRCLFLFFIRGVSLTRPVLASFVFGEFLLHIPCWLHFFLGSFSNTARVWLNFISGLCLTHPNLASFLCGEFLLHIPCWLPFMRGASLTHPMLAFCV